MGRRKITRHPRRRLVAGFALAAAAGLAAWGLAPRAQPRWMVEGVAATSDVNLNGFALRRAVLVRGRADLPGTAVVVEHDPTVIAGRVEHAWMVRDELRVRVEVSHIAPDVWGHVRDGSLARFSISVKALQSHTRPDAVEVVEDGVLVGASFTTRPADPRAVVTSWWEE